MKTRFENITIVTVGTTVRPVAGRPAIVQGIFMYNLT